MRLLICGGRDFHDAEYAFPRFDRVHQKTPVSRLICGMADGGDKLGYNWAKTRNIPIDEYWPDWKGLGRAAGPIRNEEMLKDGKPELVLGLPGGNGTAHMCRISRGAGVPVLQYERQYFSRARDLDWGWASNFHVHTQVDENGIGYRTNEHWYQAEKAIDKASRLYIVEAPDARTAKQRGQEIEVREDWDKGFKPYKIEAMMRGLRMKFLPRTALADKLIHTGDLYLVEYAPWGDQFWGVDKTYKGENWLGRLLMRRRDELLAEGA